MSEESTSFDAVGLLVGAVQASNRRDFDAMFRIFAPDAVYDLSPSGLGTYEGLAAIRGLFEEWWRAYDELESELQEAVDPPGPRRRRVRRDDQGRGSETSSGLRGRRHRADSG